MRRPPATWVAFWTFIFVLVGSSWWAGHTVYPSWNDTMTTAFAIAAALVMLASGVYFLRALRAEAAAAAQEKQAVASPPDVPTSPEDPLETCSRCGKDVPAWFFDRVDHGGIFGGGATAACLFCLEGRPRPKRGETKASYGL